MTFTITPKEIIDEQNRSVDVDDLSILTALWCVHCYPKKERSYYVYNGNSVCEECLKGK